MRAAPRGRSPRELAEQALERLLDLRELVIRKCEENPHLLNQMVFACASKELKFLVFSGAVFGFGFGVVQALCWFLLPQWWVLPFFGFLVGWGQLVLMFAEQLLVNGVQ